MNAIDERLAAEFDADAEWKAYQARVARIFTKRNGGKTLNKEEVAILADYKTVHSLTEPPKHVETGKNIPPILYGYEEAAEAFGVTRDQLYGLRSRKCPAFTGNIILAASLHVALAAEPDPKPVPLNSVHTGAKGKFTPELAASVLASLRSCPILTVVAAAHGISTATLSLWRTKGEAGQRKYAEFFNDSEAAINQSHFELLRDIGSDPDWRAKAKALELTAPDRFGRTQRLEHTGKGGKDLPPPPPGNAVTVVLQGGPLPNPYDPSTQPQDYPNTDDEDDAGE